MKYDIRITAEEMSALFPYIKVPKTHLEVIRPRILTRCSVVALLFLVRAIVIIYYPEFHCFSILKEGLANPELVMKVTQIRIALAFIISIVYLYSFYQNLYFRLVNLSVLVVLCALTIGDFQAFMMISSLDQLTHPSVAMIALRFTIVVLLFQNHMDIRRG